MIDNLTNNPRRREPLHTQWWVPDLKEMLETRDMEYLVPVRKLNAVQKALFKKLAEKANKTLLSSVPYICKDMTQSRGPSLALITEPIFSGTLGSCWSGVFKKWIDFEASPLKKFLSTLEKNVAYENPFYQETKE